MLARREHISSEQRRRHIHRQDEGVRSRASAKYVSLEVRGSHRQRLSRPGCCAQYRPRSCLREPRRCTFKQHVLVDGYGYWMGIEIADLTNNGRPDIYLSNIGNSLPAFLVKGDTRPDQRVDLSFRLLRNDGDFKFTDVTKETGADTNVFGWGVAAADFTGNGRLDLVVTENYTAFPLNWHKHFPSPGRLLVQGSDGKFVQTQHQSGVANPHFGYAALPVDLAGNGQTDLVIGNIGGPLRIFINKTPKH
jgi:hypothetical protein